MTARAGHIRFNENKPKILAALLYLIRRQSGQDQYQLVKTLFLADKKHVNEVGRPVTFDNYVAMKNGPVASFAYDMLKPSFNWEKHFGLKEAPWEYETSGRVHYFKNPKSEPNLELFSESDIEALDFGSDTILALNFDEIMALTHAHKAYREARKRCEDSNAPNIKYELFLEDWTPEQIEELEYLSQLN